jgi:hypothetical protein
MLNKIFQQKGKQWITLLLLTICLSNLHSQSYTKEERIYWLSMLWKDVSTKFHNPEHLQRVNWDSLYVANIERAINLKSDMEYYKLLEEFIAVLNDGHSEIWFNRNDSIDFLPIEIRAIREDYYVLGILMEKINKIPLGSKVLEINDLPTVEYLQKYIFPYVSAQTKQDKTRKALNYLRNNGKVNDSITFTVQTPEGQILKAGMKYNGKINRYTMNNDIVMTRFAKTQYIRETDSYLADDLFGKKYYRLRLDGFSTGNMMQIIKKMSAGNISQADYIILDLRYNLGGSESEADSLLACFLDTDTLITYPSVTRIDDAFYAAIGMPTGGSTGAPFVRNLPHHNALYRICVRRPQFPEGLFENGIQPDYFYEPSMEDVLTNKERINEYVAKLFSELKK